MDKLKMHTPDKVDDNIEKIGALFPNAVTEVIKDGVVTHAIDFDVLRQELSKVVVDGAQERYQFTWPDKRKSILLANAPIAKTLRPCRGESIDFDTTENLYIEGDNLDALKLLQETYLGKVKMIYIDPPYNTGNDFVYEDDFAEDTDSYLARSGQFDEEGGRLVANTESNGRFHTDWLNMIYPRLKLAKDLLTDDGVLFISIGEEEIGNAIAICNQIFGEPNCVTKITRIAKTASNMGTYFAPSIDYVLCYAKNINCLSPFKGEVDESLYNKIEICGLRKGERYRDDVALFQSSLTLERSRNARYFISCPDGSKCIPPENKRWRVVEGTVLEMLQNNQIVFKETKTSPLIDEYGKTSKWNLYTKSYLKDRQDSGTLPRNIFEKFINRKGADLLKTYGIPFDFAKPVELIHYICKIINDDKALIMDFFSGSATTAHAVMQLNAEDGGNRKFIMVQLPEETVEGSDAYKAGYKNICEIGKERIRRAGRKIKDEAGLMAPDLDTGFRVLKIDSTNMQEVYYNPAEIKQTELFALADNIKPDRSGEDLLFQVMLDLGILLSSKIEEKVIGGKKVFSVADGYLIACFDSDVTTEAVTQIAKMKPYYAVFRDSGMASDSVATNFEQIFATYSPTTVRKVL